MSLSQTLIGDTATKAGAAANQAAASKIAKYDELVSTYIFYLSSCFRRLHSSEQYTYSEGYIESS